MGRMYHIEARSFARWQVDRAVAERFWRDAKARPALSNVITISRVHGSGGTTVAMMVARELGLKLYDREIIEHIAQRLRTGMHQVESLDESYSSTIEDIVQGALERLPSSATYRRILGEVVRGIASQGNVVIVGRGGSFLLPQSLRVRIIAPFEVRVARVVELEGISEREARQKVARLDAQRRAFAKAHFRLDSSDPTLYDLVINTERTTLEQAATLIVTAARYRQTAVKEA